MGDLNRARFSHETESAGGVAGVFGREKKLPFAVYVYIRLYIRLSLSGLATEAAFLLRVLNSI